MSNVPRQWGPGRIYKNEPVGEPMGKRAKVTLPLEDYERLVHQRDTALSHAKDLELEFDEFKARTKQSSAEVRWSTLGDASHTATTNEEYERLKQDAELGELVRRMPVSAKLYHNRAGWNAKSYLRLGAYRCETPEKALRAALGEE